MTALIGPALFVAVVGGGVLWEAWAWRATRVRGLNVEPNRHEEDPS